MAVSTASKQRIIINVIIRKRLCHGVVYPVDEEWSIHVIGYQVRGGASTPLAFRWQR